jgi:hypothetical protein
MSLRPSPHKPACRKQSVLDWLAKSEFRNGLRVPTTIERCWQRFAFYGVPRGDIVSLLGAANILSGVLRPTPGAKRRPSAGPSFFTFSGRSGDSFYAFSSGPGIFRLAPSYVPDLGLRGLWASQRVGMGVRGLPPYAQKQRARRMGHPGFRFGEGSQIVEVTQE